MLSAIQRIILGHQTSRISVRKGSKKSRDFGIVHLFIIGFIALLIIGISLGSFVVSSNSGQPNDNSTTSTSSQTNIVNADTNVGTSQAKSQLRKDTSSKEQHDVLVGIKPADEKLIIDSLLKLAEMPSSELQTILDEKSYDSNNDLSDYFKLSSLNKGICPFESHDSITELEWLPKARPTEPSTWFKERKKPEAKNHPNVVVYYEHLSKAGGTSFCRLAKSNMNKRKEVPSYYCMPSRPDQMDARLGAWSNQEIIDYFNAESHRIVSSEWEPFQRKFLEFQAGPEGTTSGDGPILLFVTTIRNPINRLLSAYKFWGILHNSAKNKPELRQFLQRYSRRANSWKLKSQDFAANVARFNFATWKFSGGTLPVTKVQMDAQKHLSQDFLSQQDDGFQFFSHHHYPEEEESKEWRDSFKNAIQSLIQFDLAIPMELLTDHTEPLEQLLGWKNFEKAHEVPSGKVVNNNASSELSKAEYDALWNANALDMILYYWTCAVYLTRLNCAEHIIP